MQARILTTLLTLIFAANLSAATQNIEADGGPNFIAVNLKVGDNRLTDLFPNAPLGTLVFKYDNSAGWSASQMYPFGWSHPNLQILPLEGAVMYLPQNITFSTTLEGELVTPPPPNSTSFFKVHPAKRVCIVAPTLFLQT